MDMYGYLRTSVGDAYKYVWTYLDIYGRLCIFMDIDIYLWTSMAIYGHLWICMEIHIYLTLLSLLTFLAL